MSTEMKSENRRWTAKRKKVSIAKLCRWFGVPRRTFYYKPIKKAIPKLQERLVSPIKQLIEENPSYGYRTVAGLLRFNKNTVQRIFQLKGWQVRKRSVGFRPRVEVSPSKAASLNERWATDLCRVWTGRDGWASLALLIALIYMLSQNQVAQVYVDIQGKRSLPFKSKRFKCKRAQAG